LTPTLTSISVYAYLGRSALAWPCPDDGDLTSTPLAPSLVSARSQGDAQRDQAFRIDLLTFAAYSIVPVHKSTIGVVTPRPDVEPKERGQAIAIRAVDQLERLPLKRWWSLVVLQPGGGVHDILDTVLLHLQFRYAASTLDQISREEMPKL
jgi:hypothetical protein